MNPATNHSLRHRLPSTVPMNVPWLTLRQYESTAVKRDHRLNKRSLFISPTPAYQQAGPLGIKPNKNPAYVNCDVAG